MAYIDFRKLKERVSISDILDHYGLLEGLEETIQGLKGLCPFCGSNALKVSTEKNAWYCFGECKTNAKDDERYGGNILDLVARKEGVSVKRAAELIAGWFPPTEASRQSKKDSKKDVDEAKAKEPEKTPRSKPKNRQKNGSNPRMTEQGRAVRYHRQSPWVTSWKGSPQCQESGQESRISRDSGTCPSTLL